MTSSSKRLQLLELSGLADELAPSSLDRRASLDQIRSALRRGTCPTDRMFDRFLPPRLRVVSGQFWTPLEVVVRAAQWFDQLRVRSVVDIGSGAGKFCVAAALASDANFTGLEHRARLVAAARELAHLLDVQRRVSFVHGTFGEMQLPEADAYYLYNPFGENLFGIEDLLDEEVEISDARYVRDTAAVEHLLHDARVGTYLLTYNGFGGEVPASYREVRVDRDLPNVLRMWQKVGRAELPSRRSSRAS
jgi:predicted RNA methylase